MGTGTRKGGQVNELKEDGGVSAVNYRTEERQLQLLTSSERSN
jgi:hypothetical protein